MNESIIKKSILTFVILPASFLTTCSHSPRREMVIGIHHQHGDYSFSDKDLLNEGADRVLELGAKAIGIYMGPEYADYYHGVTAAADSLSELAETSHYAELFSKPFKVFSITCYSFSRGLDKWEAGIESYDPQAEYTEIRELAYHLLESYSGSGKTFILKNWEGDWQLLGSYDKDAEPRDPDLEAMKDWLAARIRAVRDARESTKFDNVEVYSAVEFNLVAKAQAGGKTLLTEVAPFLKPDLFSYSAWDSIDAPNEIYTRLEFIKEYAPDSEAFGRRNVMIGEFGFPGRTDYKVHKIKNMITQFDRWGAPVCFFWQIYGNECTDESFYPAGAASRISLECRGFGLIDPLGRRTPAWYCLNDYITGK